MRILILSWEYPPYVVGGLGRHVAELTPVLAKQGLDVHVVTPTAQKAEARITVEDGVTVHRVFAPLADAEMADIYQQAVEKNQIIEAYSRQARETFGQFDLIHVHDWLTSFAGIALKQAWNIPLVATIHATERGRVRGYLSSQLQQSIDAAEQELIREAQRVIVCSHYMNSEIQRLFHAPAAKLDMVPNAVNLTDVHDGHSREELIAFRAKYANPEDLIVFTVSRLVYEKGVHQLIQATPQILTKCPQARIVIAGRGPEAEHLKQQALDLGVSERVNFTGFISDEARNALFQTAACAVFPSLYEPFGIVALEAMALMCPIVVSDVGGFSEMVKHTETGVTVYPNDSDSIAWGVLHTLNHPERARSYALNARRSIDLIFNWPRIARLTIDVYRRVLRPQVDDKVSLQLI